MGRPRTIAVESVLDTAIEVFRQRGYYNTSMQTISDRLGISRSSIYGTFGDKQGLFEQTLHRYGATCRVFGLTDLRGASSPRAALLRVFESAIYDASDTHDQCLLINTALEFTESTPAIVGILESALGDVEMRFREAIERAGSANELAGRVDPLDTARVLVGLYLGLCALVRAGAVGEPVLRAVVRQVESLLPARSCG